MYDDIIEKFRKEYEKEIRSLFDPNSGRKTVTKKWLTSMIGIYDRCGKTIYSGRNAKLKLYRKIDLRKKEFRNLEERFKTNIPPIVEKYLNQVYERYETMHCKDSLLEILPELGCNDKREDFLKGLNKILSIIRLEHIRITGATLDRYISEFRTRESRRHKILHGFWPPYLLTYLEYYEESEWKDLYEKLRVRSNFTK